MVLLRSLVILGIWLGKKKKRNVFENVVCLLSRFVVIFPTQISSYDMLSTATFENDCYGQGGYNTTQLGRSPAEIDDDVLNSKHRIVLDADFKLQQRQQRRRRAIPSRAVPPGFRLIEETAQVKQVFYCIV
jgi:hypothetical protein